MGDEHEPPPPSPFLQPVASIKTVPHTALTKSDEDTAKKTASDSVATALARYDLPVPGGPYSKIPWQNTSGEARSGAWKRERSGVDDGV